MLFTMILLSLKVYYVVDYDLMEVDLLHMFKGNSNLTIQTGDGKIVK